MAHAAQRKEIHWYKYHFSASFNNAIRLFLEIIFQSLFSLTPPFALLRLRGFAQHRNSFFCAFFSSDVERLSSSKKQSSTRKAFIFGKTHIEARSPLACLKMIWTFFCVRLSRPRLDETEGLSVSYVHHKKKGRMDGEMFSQQLNLQISPFICFQSEWGNFFCASPSPRSFFFVSQKADNGKKMIPFMNNSTICRHNDDAIKSLQTDDCFQHKEMGKRSFKQSRNEKLDTQKICCATDSWWMRFMSDVQNARRDVFRLWKKIIALAWIES